MESHWKRARRKIEKQDKKHTGKRKKIRKKKRNIRAKHEQSKT
jgi:hypothetical protein